MFILRVLVIRIVGIVIKVILCEVTVCKRNEICSAPINRSNEVKIIFTEK